MASDNRESSNSEDEEVHLIHPYHCKRQSIISSDESDYESGSENESDSEIRPQATGSTRQICDTESDDDCVIISSSHNAPVKRHCSVIVERKPDGTTQAAAINDSSDGEQSEKCAICLSKFNGQDMASPDKCDHTFCPACLQEWAKKVNTCPIDRKKFDTILVRHHGESKIFRVISVANKELPVDDYDDDEEESDFSDSNICAMCGDANETDTILVCDHCLMAYHRNCLHQPVVQRPEPCPWRCPTCCNFEIRSGIVLDFQDFAIPLNRPSLATLFEASVRNSARAAAEESRNLAQTGALNANDTSSSDSSDENTPFSSSLNRRRHCQEIRNRRQNRIPRHRASQSAFTPVQQSNGLLPTSGSGEEVQCYDCDDDNVVSRVRRRTYPTVKNVLFSCGTIFPSHQRAQPYTCPTSNDIVNNILQLETLLQSPSRDMLIDGSLTYSSSNGGQQHPLNPAQSTPSKCSTSSSQPNSSFASSSSSSSGSASSQYRDLHNNMPACSMLKTSMNADGYDTDSCSMVAHRSYGSSVPEELKRDGRESAHSKDTGKTHSDEEVDIYSDIDSTNEDETSLDTEMQAVNIGYKSEESHLAAAVGDGSDSSDNDLVIDEDRHADEDAEKARVTLSKSEDALANTDLIMEVNEESSTSELSQEPLNDSSSLQITDNIQSPDPVDETSQNSNSNYPTYTESSGSFRKDVENEGEEEMKVEPYDSDADSDDSSSLGNEADEENSMHSVKMSTIEEQSLDANHKSPILLQEGERLDFQMENASQQIKQFQSSSCDSVNDHNEVDDASKCDVADCEGENASENEEVTDDDDDDACQSDEDSNDKIVTINLEDSNDLDSMRNNVGEICSDDADKIKSDVSESDNNSDVKGDNIDVSVNNDSPICLTPKFDDNDSNKELHPIEDHVDSGNEKMSTNSNEFEDCGDHVETEGVSGEEEDVSFEKESDCEATSGNIDDTKDEEDVKEVGGKNADDLGIEDISDVASEDLNQPDGGSSSMDCDPFHGEVQQDIVDEVEKNVAQLFAHSSPEVSVLAVNKVRKTDERKRQPSLSKQPAQDDQEEGEIVEDLPFYKKDGRQEYFSHEDDDFMDSTPRVNISDLPRIPKIKRDSSKVSEPEEPPLEVKRTSVLGRVDLGNSDISWKRLSQHTRERSYRDGRPKDESVLFRDREPRQKERKNKNEEKYRDSERSKKEESKKQESVKSRDRSDKNSRDRKSERQKSEHEKNSCRQSEKLHSVSEKRDKHSKSHDRAKQDKYEQSKNERESSKKEKRDKYKEKGSRDDSKYDRDKCRVEEKYKRDSERYEFTSDRYERCYEKSKEKEYKYKHKDRRESRERKSEVSTSKKSKDDKRRRSHSIENYSEKLKEREVRKVDDKLKIVVEHKEVKKDKAEKHFDKKHDKKHRENSHHHHEKKKKEIITSTFSDVTPTPIESKEIFAKGDSIIINVSFNRASPREVISSSTEDMFGREKKNNMSHMSKADSTVFSDENSKSKHSLHDKDSIFADSVAMKHPSTPEDRIDKSPDDNDSFWQETDDAAGNSPQTEKCTSDKNCSDDDESSTLGDNYGADDPSDSDASDNLTETQSVSHKEEDEFMAVAATEKQTLDLKYTDDKESDNFSGSRRRSPQPPSPPSPADNDSYDPCEPTRSPSPSPPPVPPPLPTKGSGDHPKPPPSPELPPLPPGPEPTDSILRDDPRSVKCAASSQTVEVTSSSTPIAAQQAVAFTQTTTVESSVPNVLMPPPSFPPRSTGTAMQSQVMPPKTVNWQVPNPPPAPLMFPPNHVHSVIRGNFLPSHIPRMGLPPQNASSAIMPPTNSIPLMSQVRHLQLTHGVMQNNPLMANVPLSISQLQMPHMNHPATNSISAQHQMASMQSHPSSLSTVRVMPMQGQLSSIAVTIQNQHVANVMQNQAMGHFMTSQSQVQAPPAGHKVEKFQKNSPAKEKSEVVDMDVDSPYSPGDSPSMDSNYDYSPPSSPVQKTPPDQPDTKDAFDVLVAPERQAGAQDKTPSKGVGKSRQLSNSSDTPSKKAKLDAKAENSAKSRHSVRLQVTDKVKAQKEQKTADKKDIYSKLDDTQLKILDDLPSSAVEMQVKEKFLKKLNRQERVVEEVKLVLKPYYKTREVNKEEYKDILRKSVPKICHNKSGEINPVKVKHLVESYVKKVKHARKKSSKRHKASKYS